MFHSTWKLFLSYLIQRRWLPVLIVLTVGLCLSLVLFQLAYRFEKAQLETQFAERTNYPAAEISSRVQKSFSSVHSLVAFFESSEFVDRQEFNRFAASILAWNPSIQALEWLPRVLPEDRVHHETMALRDGLRGYRIRERNPEGILVPASARPEFFPVFYVEPLKGNEAALGFDVVSEPTRHAMLFRARQSNKVAVSDAIFLVQSESRELGVLVAAPLFDGFHSDKRLEGFVLVVLNIPKLVEEALEPWEHASSFGDFFLFSAGSEKTQQLLFARQKTRSARPEMLADITGPYVSRDIQVADQRWRLVITPPPGWPTPKEMWRPWALWAILLALTVAGTVIYRLRLLGLMEQQRLTETLREKNQNLEKATKTLAKYLPPQVWNAVLSESNPRLIGAKRKPLTVFFGDIVGFTNLSQDMRPDELTYILNDFFSEMSDIGQRYGATLDKFAGDAVIMFFGDPTSRGYRQDAAACVEMALEMQMRMDELREKWLGLGLPYPLHMRIGIHSGDCNVGNFGSNSRMSYTIVGLTANLAARIEKLGIPDGVTITDETRQLLQGQFECIPLRHVHIRGIDYEVQLFSVAA